VRAVAAGRARNARCHQHRSVPAGWRCDACQKYLCPDCTASAFNLFYCCLCEEKATQLTVPRGERSFLEWITDALIYPLRRGLAGLIFLAVLCTAAHLAATMVLDPPSSDAPAEASPPPPAPPPPRTGEDPSLMPPSPPPAPAAAPAASAERPLSPMVFPPVRVFLVFVYAVLVVIGTARGGKREPKAFLLAVKALAGTLILWVPAVAYLVLVVHGLPGRDAFTSPMAWLFAVLAAVYLPMALAAAASDAGFLEVGNPFRLFGWAAQTGRHYWMTIVGVALLAALSVALTNTGAQVAERVHVAFLSQVIAELFALLAVAAMARMVGRILWVHGHAFDWGPESHFSDPLLADPPRGNRKRPPPVAAAQGTGAPGEEGTGIRQKPEPMVAREIIEALAARSTQRALKLYESRPSWSEKLFTERHLLDLGTAALNAAKLELAERTLARAAQSKGPVAGRAMLALARAQEQGGKDPATVRALWQQIVERFPGTDMARAASAKLDAAPAPAPPP
jgi:hypothetical protein